MMRTTLLAVSCIFFTTISVAADLIPGAERALTHPFPSPASGDQWEAEAAVNDEGFIVFWTGYRGVYATRFVSGGVPRDAYSRQVPIGSLPLAVGAGSDFLLAWTENGAIYSGALRRDGQIGQRHEIGTLAPAPGSSLQTSESVLFLERSGNIALVVVWDSSRLTMRARMLRVDGAPATAWIDLGFAFSASGIRGIALGSDPEGFLLLHIDAQELHGHRIRTAGEITRFRMQRPQPAHTISLAFSGSEYVVVMQNESDASAPIGTSAMLLSPDGEVLSNKFHVLSSTHRINSLLWSRQGALLFVDLFDPHKGAALRIDRQSHQPGHLNRVADAGPRAVATDGRLALVVWVNYGRDGDLYGRWIDSESGEAASSEFVVATGAADQRHPQIALGRTADLVVWQELDKRSLKYFIRMIRLRPDGTTFPLDTGSDVSDRTADGVDPSVTFDGQQFLVVWSEQKNGSEGRVMARRVAEAGEFLDETPLVIASQPANTTTVGYVDGVFLVVWSALGDRSFPTHGRSWDVFGARVTASGVVLDPSPILISRDDWNHYSPHVAAGAGRFLVGWHTQQWFGHHSPVYNASSVALVSTSGTVSEPIVLQPLRTRWSLSPVVAWNGSEYLAAWSTDAGTYATRISADGAVLDRGASGEPGLHITAGAIADIAFFQGSWAIVESRNEKDLAGMFLGSDLQPELLFPVATSPDHEVDADIVSDGQRSVVVYSRLASEEPYNGAARLMARVFDTEGGEVPLPPARRRAVKR